MQSEICRPASSPLSQRDGVHPLNPMRSACGLGLAISCGITARLAEIRQSRVHGTFSTLNSPNCRIPPVLPARYDPPRRP